jgi:hypothetical protein
MRNSATVAGTLAALVLTGGIAAAQAAPAPSAAPAAVSAVPTHTGNIVCAKNNTRELTIFDKTCPSGTHFWAQVPVQDVAGLAGVGVPGPAGPAGPKGDPGTTSVVVKSGTAVLAPTDDTPAEAKTITLTGLPAFEAGAVEAQADNGAALAGTADLVVVPVAPASGSTERSFKVYVTGLVGAASFTAKVTVIAVP